MTPWRKPNSHRRILTGLLLGLTLGLPTGCERKPGGPNQAATTQPAASGSAQPGAPVAALPPFTPPKLSEIEQRGMPMALEMKISSAYHDASAAPDDVVKVGTLGAIYFAHGFPLQAAQCLARAAQLKPQEMPWQHGAGIAYEQAGRRAEAVAAFKAALAIQSSYIPTCLHLADLLAAEDPTQATGLYQQALGLDPMNARAHFGLGRAALAQGNQQKALEDLRRALGAVPDYADVHRTLAEALKAAGQSAEAEKHVHWAEGGGTPPPDDDPVVLTMRRRGLDSETLCNDAMTLAQQGQLDRAEAFIKQAVDVGGASAQTGVALGTLRALQKRFDDATAEFRRALQADPNSVVAKSNLGQVLAEQGQADEAERVFREILAKHPTDTRTLQRFDALVRKQNKPDETIRLEEQALQADPDNVALRFTLAVVLAGAQRNDDAIAQLRKAVELRPEFLLARTSLGNGLQQKGDFAGAKVQWEEVLKLHPKYTDAYMALALLAKQQKDAREAERVLREGLQRAPESHLLLNSLAWMLATSADEAQRKGQEAVELGEKCCRITQNSQHAYMDTLAAAYAEAGRFDDAVHAARQAIDIATKAGDTAALEIYKHRLASYEQKKPFHESN